MKNNSTWILLCLACMMTLSCSDKKNTADESEKGVSTVLPDTKNEVAVQILKKRDFNHELVSNGKISARGKADLRFETGEVIAHIYVKNGDRVQKGQKLADLDKFRLEQKLSQSEDALLKAELELKDVLIGQGYSPDLENELAFIRMGDKVVITPYAGGDAFEGSVSEINPLVDANGMVKVKALVNAGGKLFSGMNVRVSVRRSLGERLVIPKSAVVLRSGKQVVFTLKDGKAMWNYVNTGLENATECVVSDKSQKGIEDGLLEGDTVIVTGNLNLAHEAEVYVK